MPTYPASNYEISEELIRKGWAEQERIEKEMEARAAQQRELIAQQYPQSRIEREHETIEGRPAYKTHQQQEIWMAADEKNGVATYDKPVKQLTTLEVRNLRSELKNLEGELKQTISTFQRLNARQKQIQETLGIPVSE